MPMLMMRRRLSIRCCVTICISGISVIIILQILLWSGRDNPSSSQLGRVVFKPRRDMDDIRGDPKQDVNSGQYVIVDNSVDYLKNNVDSKFTNNLGIIQTPEDQETRDDGDILCL